MGMYPFFVRIFVSSLNQGKGERGAGVGGPDISLNVNV